MTSNCETGLATFKDGEAVSEKYWKKKGEEAFVAAVRALKAGESGGEVAAAEEGLDGGDGGGRERAEGFAVVRFVVCEEVIPAVVNQLPEGRGAGTAGLVDGRHKKCS